MARRPFSFGVRLRDGERDQTLRIRACDDPGRGFWVEREKPGTPIERRRHDSLAEAVRDGARSWRHRLN